MTSAKLPEVGEVYGHGKLARTVTGVQGRNVFWKNAEGRTGGCWYSTWDSWVAKQARRKAQPDPRDARIAELEGLVRKAYTEGYFEGRMDGLQGAAPDWATCWDKSESKEQLEAPHAS